MLTKFTALIISVVLISVFISTCAYFTQGETDLVVKITARRLAAYGVQEARVPFLELGKIAQGACDRPKETLSPAAAMETIAALITMQLDDPLLAADLKDLLAAIGVRLDPAMKLLGVTPEIERLIKIAVCAFAEGVRLKPVPG